MSKFFVTVFDVNFITLIESAQVDSLEAAFEFVQTSVLQGTDQYKDIVWNLRVNRGVITQASIDSKTAEWLQDNHWYRSVTGDRIGSILIQSQETAMRDLAEGLVEGNDRKAQARALGVL